MNIKEKEDPILKSKKILLFLMKLAPMMMMMEFVEFHLQNFHHHLYYLLNQNKLNLVLQEKKN
jgi:hypothetical protein